MCQFLPLLKFYSFNEAWPRSLSSTTGLCKAASDVGKLTPATGCSHPSLEVQQWSSNHVHLVNYTRSQPSRRLLAQGTKVEPRAVHRGSPSRHMQSFGGLLLMRFFPCTISSVSPRFHCVELAGMVRAVAGSIGAPPHSHARVRRSKENQFHIVGRLSHTRRISPRRWSDHTSVGSVGALADWAAHADGDR
jgi:hypothetical protein